MFLYFSPPNASLLCSLLYWSLLYSSLCFFLFSPNCIVKLHNSDTLGKYTGTSDPISTGTSDPAPLANVERKQNNDWEKKQLRKIARDEMSKNSQECPSAVSWNTSLKSKSKEYCWEFLFVRFPIPFISYQRLSFTRPRIADNPRCQEFSTCYLALHKLLQNLLSSNGIEIITETVSWKVLNLYFHPGKRACQVPSEILRG